MPWRSQWVSVVGGFAGAFLSGFVAKQKFIIEIIFKRITFKKKRID